MKFDWDEGKSQKNLSKHRIDFESATNLWLDDNRIEIDAPHPVEDRHIMIGRHLNKLWAAVYTIRGNTTRIISVRRARKREVHLYEKENPGQE